MQVLVWTWEEDVSDFMLSRVTFNFIGGKKKISVLTVTAVFTEHELKNMWRPEPVVPHSWPAHSCHVSLL